jgi:hypothetical protein
VRFQTAVLIAILCLVSGIAAWQWAPKFPEPERTDEELHQKAKRDFLSRMRGGGVFNTKLKTDREILARCFRVGDDAEEYAELLRTSAKGFEGKTEDDYGWRVTGLHEWFFVDVGFQSEGDRSRRVILRCQLLNWTPAD